MKWKKKKKIAPPIWVGSQIPNTLCEMKFADNHVVLEIKSKLEINNAKELQGALDKYNFISTFPPPPQKKKIGVFYTIRSVGMGSGCMLSFTF